MRQYLINLKMIDVSVIIVSYNTKKLTLRCIKSVLDEGSDLKKEIIVIDNASSDGTKGEIRKIKNRCLIIENDKNLGFAKACNLGIKSAKGKYILLLNSDTRVKKQTIKKLVDFANNNKLGAVGPKLLNPDGTVQASVFRQPTVKRAFRQYFLNDHKLLDKYAPGEKKPVCVEVLVMAAFLISPEAKEKVGLLNEKYFMYFEDLDYCKRILEKGLKIYYLPFAEVIHHHGASAGKSRDQWRILKASSLKYHGAFGHYLFNIILWFGQKWQKFSKR